MCPITPRSTYTLGGGPHSASQARRFVEAAMCREHAQQVSGDVVLLASELVAHSLSTGTTPTTLSIECHISQLQIWLCSAGQEIRNAEAHRSLRKVLIEELASRWGVDADTDNCTYWCVLAYPVDVPGLRLPGQQTA